MRRREFITLISNHDPPPHSIAPETSSIAANYLAFIQLASIRLWLRAL